MINIDKIQYAFKASINIEPINAEAFRLILPFYHEDGDMIDIFIKEEPDGSIRIFDNGLTLMRLSYTFELNTDNKQKIFNKILNNNFLENNKGNLFIIANYDNFVEKINSFTQAIAKITSMEYLNKETVSSLFYDYVNDFLFSVVAEKYDVKRNFSPYHEAPAVPYKITPKAQNVANDIYLFTVKDNIAALRSTVTCCNLKLQKKNYFGIAVCEDLDVLSKKDRSTLVNILDKTFANVDGMRENFMPLLDKIAS